MIRIMYRLLRPLLFLLPPEAAHTVTLKALQYLHRFGLLKSHYYHNPVHAFGIDFPNPVGLAAGLDKNAEYIDALATLGFGFIEVGTVTPKPQPGNPKPRLFRLPKATALINRFGFNSRGLEVFVKNLQKTKFTGVLGVNIGKNKTTPNEDAWDDYQQGMQAAYPYASYLTINISSPNTPGLRELQSQKYLDQLLENIKKEQAKLAKQHNRTVPVLLKVAPDLNDAEIDEMAAALLKHKMDGIIATNASFSRQGVEQLTHAQEQGGLSGAPIAELSTQVLNCFQQKLQGKMPIIGLGGIVDQESAQAKFKAGATLIQVYTGLIYRGPQLIQDIYNAQ